MMEDLVDKQTTPSPFSFFVNNLTPPLLTERSVNAVLCQEEGVPIGVGGCLKKEKIKFIEYNRGYIDYAKQNRKKSTKVEIIFWSIVKNRQFF